MLLLLLWHWVSRIKKGKKYGGQGFIWHLPVNQECRVLRNSDFELCCLFVWAQQFCYQFLLRRNMIPTSFVATCLLLVRSQNSCFRELLKIKEIACSDSLLKSKYYFNENLDLFPKLNDSIQFESINFTINASLWHGPSAIAQLILSFPWQCNVCVTLLYFVCCFLLNLYSWIFVDLLSTPIISSILSIKIDPRELIDVTWFIVQYWVRYCWDVWRIGVT